MTATNKPVRRVTERTYGVLFPFNRKKHRRVVAQLGPGDIVQFRELGRRQWYSLTIDQAFVLAVKGAAGFRLCMLPPQRPKRGSPGSKSSA